MGIMGQGDSGQENELAGVVADYQTGCYHTRTVVVKINY